MFKMLGAALLVQCRTGYRVYPTLTEGVAAQDPPHSQGRPLKKAVDLYSFQGIVGASGIVAAGSRKERRNCSLVKADQAQASFL